MPLLRTDTCEAFLCAGHREQRSSFCLEHCCLVPGCPEKSRPNTPFCESHSCREPDCSAPANRPGGRRGENGEFCPDSRICSHWTCNQRVDCLDNGEMGAFCCEHRCGWNGCGNKRKVGRGSYCDEHKCRRPGCVASIVVVDGQFCVDHECSRMSCRMERHDSSRWCVNHGCARRGCEAAAEEEIIFCRRHSGHDAGGGGRAHADDQYGNHESYPFFSHTFSSPILSLDSALYFYSSRTYIKLMVKD